MKKLKYLIFTFLMISVVGCDDFETNLEVPNTENPSDLILTSDPVALESLANSIIFNWWDANHRYAEGGIALSTMSDVFTCSWGNAGMRDLSSEPRAAYNNSSSYGNAGFNETYFNSLYSVLSDSNTLMFAIANGTEFTDNAQIEVIGRFGQALSIGYLAMVYDRVWLSDENGPINDGEYVGYAEAMAFALEKLDQAIAVATANNVGLPANAIPGHTYGSSDFIKILNSFGARMTVMNSRTPAERDAIVWTKVLQYANLGLSNRDFEVTTDADVIWDDYKWVLCQFGWARTDMYVVNLMDPSAPKKWPAGAVTMPESTSADARLLTDYEYLSSQDFIPARGDYHYSSYRYSRYDFYLDTQAESMPDFTVSENDMYKAEAMLRTNNLSGAAGVINAGTRVTRGNLPPVSATDAIAIAKAIHYERVVEFPLTGMALPFFEMRKEGLLQAGTMFHYPVPGKALASIPAPIYTFGGTQGVAGVDYSTGGWELQ
ncbi:MAG: hypothetical protein ACYC01_08310 [Lutibacter sp.]